MQSQPPYIYTVQFCVTQRAVCHTYAHRLLLWYIHLCVLQCNFLFSMVWSIGATTEADGREKFDVFFRDLVGGKKEAHPVPDAVGKLEVPLPADSLVFDFMFEVRCARITSLSVVIW